jgi:putative transposase
VKYALIRRHRRVWPIRVQCRMLGVSVAGYPEHFVRRRQIARRRHLSAEALVVQIRAVYVAHRGAYGWPRVWRELRAQGIRVGKQRMQKLMRQHGIRARGKRRFRVTTDSRHGLPIAPNLRNRNFTVAVPNQAWTGDITYPNQPGLAFPGRGHRPVQPPRGGLVDATGDAQPSAHRCAGDGLAAPQSRSKCQADLP